MKRRYRRYFIMLELEDKNFSAFVNEETKGYAKVEIKNNQGLLSIYCQNIKNGSSGNRYQWYLINTKTDGEPIIAEIGPMEVDEKGQGEVVCEFDPENVKGSMEQMDNFNVLALVALDEDGKGKLYTPLVGYIDKERPGTDSWLYTLSKYLYVPLGRDAMVEEKMVPLHSPPEEVIEKMPEEVIESDVKEVTEEIIEEVKEEIAEEVIEEVKEEVMEEITEEAVEEVAEEIIEEIKEEVAEEVIEEVKEEAMEEIIEEVIEGIAKDAVEEGVAEKIAEEVKEKDTEEIIEKVIEETTEETTKKIEKDIAEEIAEKIAEKAEEKPIKEAEEKTEKIMEKDIKETRGNHEDGKFVSSKPEQRSMGTAEVKKDEYVVQVQKYIENSLKDFPKVEPFVDNLSNYIWWQIPYNTQTMYRSYMPFILYLDSLKESTDSHDSSMLQIVYIHQHHIFGISYDENKKAKYYAYGISGRNLPLEQPFESNKELIFWHPCNNVPVNIESQGYWILTIDPKTGDAIKYK